MIRLIKLIILIYFLVIFIIILYKLLILSILRSNLTDSYIYLYFKNKTLLILLSYLLVLWIVSFNALISLRSRRYG